MTVHVNCQSRSVPHEICPHRASRVSDENARERRASFLRYEKWVVDGREAEITATYARAYAGAAEPTLAVGERRLKSLTPTKKPVDCTVDAVGRRKRTDNTPATPLDRHFPPRHHQRHPATTRPPTPGFAGILT